MPSHDWTAVRNLLAVCPGGANTLPPTLPALRQLHQALPAARVSLWTTARGRAWTTARRRAWTTADAEPVAEQLTWLHELLVSPAAWTATLLPLTAAIESRDFDAAIIFTALHESPYPAAYTCYLAGIPIRAGQSSEFGGSILSSWVRPAATARPEAHHLYLLQNTLPDNITR